MNPEVLQSLYGHLPDLSSVRIRSINLNWRGPTVTLRVDLPSFPGSPPQEWIDAGMDTVQCQFEFLAVERISLTDWAPPAVGGIEMTPWGRERRMRVGFSGSGSGSGSGMTLGFDCYESVSVRHVSAFTIQEDGSDSGRRLFVSKVDARRHTSLPGTDEKTFYER
ncbi:Imm50 family immunity protein [Streptomyces lutosisoli]|uniref:Imm50 family immunity protein n=1 Tax=Streptomyces lutosisoli TaxID=2665721 RepID=A0ABW2VLF2_9ACTN